MTDGTINLVRTMPYAVFRGEGENACIRGPENEVVLEIWHGDDEQQWALASLIAQVLNQRVSVPVGKMILEPALAVVAHHA